MTGAQYQKLAMRTNDGKSFIRMANIITEYDEKIDIGDLLMGCLGLAGESGELLDFLQRPGSGGFCSQLLGAGMLTT